MNKKIANQETKVPTGTKLNEKDYMMELLTYLKCLEKNYAEAMTEASNEKLFNKYNDMFNKISGLQRDTFEAMFQKGWYQLEKVSTTKVDEKIKKLTNEVNVL